MFQNRFRLCELFGIPLYLDFSLLILLLLFTGGGESFHAGIVTAFLLLFSITAHELGHALAARAFGYQTRDITLSLLGGCASIIALPRKASQEFAVAVAGPLVSVALSLAGTVAVWLIASHGGLGDAALFVLENVLWSFGIDANFHWTLATSRQAVWLVRFAAYFGTMNLMLAVFNMLPGFPMDGGRVFRSAMSPALGRVKATFVAMCVGRVFAVLLGLRGLYNFMTGGGWGVVTMLIAWMIWKEGYREYLLAKSESSWRFADFRARVSPPPYGGDEDEAEVGRGWGG